MSWQERTALVTGGSRGIGRAVTRRLAQSGIRVGINYRSDEAAAKALVDTIRSQGGEAQAFQADVSDPEQAEHLVESVRRQFGTLDILINNAGISRDTLLPRMQTVDWETVIATNLHSVFHCTKAAIKVMIRQRFGRIVSVSSVAGLVGNVGQSNYAAAKAGIIGFTKAVAKEWASRGITANVVAPGLITTDLTHAMSDAQRAVVLEHIPLGRAGQPDEVADAVWYLVQAGYVTGQVLVVDGGLSMQ